MFVLLDWFVCLVAGLALALPLKEFGQTAGELREGVEKFAFPVAGLGFIAAEAVAYHERTEHPKIVSFSLGNGQTGHLPAIEPEPSYHVPLSVYLDVLRDALIGGAIVAVGYGIGFVVAKSFARKPKAVEDGGQT